MSGAHSQHRTPNRPLIVDGQPVLKLDSYGRPVTRYKLTPGMENANGRPTGYHIFEYFAVAHVLDYSPAFHRPSKHKRGQSRPRTAAERTRVAGLQRRFVQASKRSTLLEQQLVAQAA